MLASRSSSPPPQDVEADGLPVPRRYWAMLAIGLGITMAVLDSSVANVALPTIARQLGASPAEATWVVNAYQLATVVTLLPFAALGERLGYRRVYLFGLVVFTAGSLACALSHSLTALVLSRVLQGIGASGIMGMNGALVRYTYPQATLGRGVGLNALVVSFAAAIGPTVASGILAIGSWEWLFAVNVPLGIINLALASRALPDSPLADRPLDWLSAALNALLFGLFFIGADGFAHGRAGDAIAAAEIAVAVVAGLWLWRRERRARQPLIPLDLFKNPVFALSVATSICSFTAYMLAYVSLPFYFESALGRDAVQTGLLMTAWPVALGVAAPVAGWLSDRWPAAVLGALGLSALAAGLTLLATMPAQATSAAILWRMAICGFGFGFFQAPNNRVLLGTAPRARAGAAGGMLAVARLLGFTAGATLAASVFRLAPAGAETIDLALGAGLSVTAALASLARLAAPAQAVSRESDIGAPARDNA